MSLPGSLEKWLIHASFPLFFHFSFFCLSCCFLVTSFVMIDTWRPAVQVAFFCFVCLFSRGFCVIVLLRFVYNFSISLSPFCFVLFFVLFCFFFWHDRPSQLKRLPWLWAPSIHFSTVFSWCSRFKACLKSLTLHLLKRYLFLRRKSYLDVSSKIPLKQLGALLPGDVRSAWKLPRKFLNY